MPTRDSTPSDDSRCCRTLRVLIVEDSPADAELVELELTNGGYHLSSSRVNNAAEFSEALANQDWDLITADYSLPSFGALAALELLKQSGRDIPFIIVSGTITDEMAVAAMRAGAHDYVLKHNIARLLPAIEREQKESESGQHRREADSTVRHLSAIVESSDEAIIGKTLEGIVTSWNRGAERLYRYTAAEMVGNPMSVLIPEDRSTELSDILRRLVAGEHIEQYETVRRRRDGTLVDVSVKISPILDTAGKIVGASSIAHDITTRKQAERDLQHSRALLAEAERLSHTGAWEWNVETDRWLFSDEWLAIHGCKTAPLKAADLLPIAHPEDREVIAGAFENARNGIAPYDVEHRIVRQDNGEVRTVLARGRYVRAASGEVTKLYGFAQDITDRKQAEDALRSSEERLRAFVTASSDVIYSVNGDWSEMRRLDGRGFLSDTEKPNKNWLQEYIHPQDQAEVLDAIQTAVRTKSVYELEHRVRRADGSLGWTLSRAVPLFDEKGEITEWFGTASDVTPRRQTEDALRESEERVRVKLNSIVSPEGDLGTLELADVIDAPALQALFEDFYNLTHIPVSVIDLQGRVLVGAGWQDICTNFHRVNADSCKHCIDSDRELSAEVPAGEYKLYQCKNHMWDVVTPIILGDKHIGNVFSGQFFFEDETPNLELFREQARIFGFPEPEYLAALARVPRLSRETLNVGMNYLMKLAEMISKLSYSNLTLARSLAERERLTAALQQSEQRFRDMAENVPQMVWVADSRANFHYLSPKWLDYTATTVEQNTDGRWADFLHPEDRPASVELWKKVVAERSVYEAEYRVRRYDGEYRWHLGRAVPIVDPKSNTELWFGTTTDIHERKKAQEALIRSEKLASVGRMAATIAHEINNPLASAINSIYLASTAPAQSESVHKHLNLAERELERVAHITRQTLGFYRETGQPTPVNVPEVVNGVLDLYGPKLKNKAISVQRRYRTPSSVRAIEGELRQIVSNLVSNSIDALGTNGMLHIRTSCPGLNNGQRPKVRVTIADNGAGINSQHLKRIFEPFFTTKEAIGTGLGLWVTKELVNKHEGRIRVRSRVGKGTVFSIWLPADPRST
ncbi:MAG TPA: PAS domain S-box protein [Terriglobales bacterium]|nr:PAS domain S-box protein [Terriglobales bacterium]